MFTNQTSVDDNLELTGTKDESSFRGTIRSISKLPWLTPKHKPPQKNENFEQPIEFDNSQIISPVDSRNHISS